MERMKKEEEGGPYQAIGNMPTSGTMSFTDRLISCTQWITQVIISPRFIKIFSQQILSGITVFLTK